MNEREVIVDALKRVQIALATPNLTDIERCILEMEYIRGHNEADVASSLVLRGREYKAHRLSLFDKITAPLADMTNKPPTHTEML